MIRIVIGSILLVWTYGALTVADNYATKFFGVVFIGIPGIGLTISGIRAELKNRER
jgi:hypothetical protein